MTAVLDAPVAVPPAAGRTRSPLLVATLVSAAGLLIQSVAYALGWAEREQPAIVVYYVGLVVVIAPYAVLLTRRGITGTQRLLGAVCHAEALYLSWLLSNPVMATRFDETLHVTTLLSLTEGDGLFSGNAMLPVSPHYPGLELAASAVHWLTGLPLMACQVVVVGLSRAVLALALFWLGTRLGRSTRVGAMFVLLYSASAQFYFFNAQFSYQTIGLAMLAAAFALMLQAADAEPGPRRVTAMVAAQACLTALAITHHLTSWLTLGTLWGLALLFWLGAEKQRAWVTLVTAQVATAVAAAWTALIAPLLAGYLGPVFETAGGEIARLIALDPTGSREVLADSSGQRTPTWEVAWMATSILVWCLLLLPALWGALRGDTVPRSSGRLLLMGLAAAYPVLFLVRFFPTASDVATRASTFVEMAMSLLVALWLVRRGDRLRRLLAPGAVLLVIGGVMLGYGPDWQRVPGPFLPGAEQRSVDAQTVAFARWAGRYLPDGARMTSDVTLNRVVPDFGPVVPITQQAGNDNLTSIYIAPVVDDEVISLLQDNRVDFIAVDTRTIDERSLSGSYYEAGSAFGPEASLPTRQMLLKFEQVPGAEVVLDGPITVFDVRALRGEPRDFVDRGDPGLPGTWVPWQVLLVGLGLLVALVGRRRELWTALAQAGPGQLWLAAVVVPALMLVGAIGVLIGQTPVGGTAAAACLVTAGVRALKGRPRDAARPRVPWGLLVVTTATLLAAVVVAAVSAHDGLTHVDPPPAPSGTSAGSMR